MAGRVSLICALIFLSGCSQLAKLTLIGGPRKTQLSMIRQAAFTDQTEPKVVYVLSNGFHTGLVMKRADISLAAWPEIERLPDLWR